MKRFSQLVAGLLVAILLISVPATAVEASWFRNLFRRDRGQDETQATIAAEALEEAGLATDVPAYMNETGFPIAKQPITLTKFYLEGDTENSRWDELELMQWLEDLTNIKWEYDVLNDTDQYLEQLNLRFLSGSYPDVINPRGALSGGRRWVDEEAYGKEGFLIDHRPLIARWMPNLQNFFNEYPVTRVGQTASDGNMYGLPFYYLGGVGGNPHNWYMETYFATLLGYDYDNMPTSVEELDKFMYDLKAILDSGDYFDPDPEMVVLGMRAPWGTGPMTNVLLTAFTGAIISAEGPWAVPDNKNVQFMVEHPGFRAALEMWARWYRDGIINQDMITIEPAVATNNKNNLKYAMFSGSSSSLDAERIRDRHQPWAEERGFWGCTSIRPMTSEFNDTPRVNYETLGNMTWFAITDNCRYPEAVARWADIFYNLDYDITDNDTPNPLMFYIGKYDVHWTHVDKPANTTWTFMNQPGTDEKITWTYSRAHLVPGWAIPAGAYIMTEFAEGSPMFISKQHTNVHLQFPYVTTDTQFPPLARWTDDETDAAAAKLTDLSDYLRESWAHFTIGQRALTDANWDAFVAECYRLGAGEITEIYQGVFDRWNAEMGN